ncbi:Crp/Fnr family transcriptional regulator [Tenacibaculum agarivorans]|uniref:Crp/Fnr family transcriptional regulator n=1 Tax=Tenacibaculum agarivorans TaxID=1908389 RepID=UPI00094BA931|nr:Crp/Fnr family transcriptional regulator [Tenacibaculum agarivorans]
MTLTEFIGTYQTLTKEEKDLINKNITFRKFNAKEYFLESGNRSNEIGFILSGIFRYFFYDSNGKEITAHFMIEKEFVGSATSFFEYMPSSGSLQAITDCEIIVISRQSWELFCRDIKNWENSFQKILNEVLIKKTNFQRGLLNTDAKTAYLKFLNTYPNVAQKAPLNYIASFLGITPFSLSRIRKAIASL